MRLQDILDKKDREVVTIDPGRTVQEAIRKLCEHRIGALIVVDDSGSLLGIVSERDILMDCGYQCTQLEVLACPEHQACPRRVEEIMTRDMITGAPGDELKEVMKLMTDERIRHLPVLDDGQLVGIISIGDVVAAHLGQSRFENASLRQYINNGAGLSAN